MVTYEVEPIATVVGGHTRVQDDYQGGVESVIRLNDVYPPGNAAGHRGVLSPDGDVAFPPGAAGGHPAARA